MDLAALRDLSAQVKGARSDYDDLTRRFNDRYFFQLLSKAWLKWKLFNHRQALERLDTQLNRSVNQFLQHDNSSYFQLISENRGLLCQHDFLMKVYRTEMNQFSTTERVFEGVISGKGYLYLFVQKVNVPILNSQLGLMASEFAGNFDESGNFTATSVKDSYFPVIHKIPDIFKARAYEDSAFRMVAERKQWDFSGREFVDRMIGDPFNDNSRDRVLYLRNREKISEMKEKFIRSL